MAEDINITIEEVSSDINITIENAIPVVWGGITGILSNQEDLQEALNNKVDNISDKGLSTNDLTNILKSNYDTAYTNNHTHINKTILDNTTASFTTTQETNLNNQSGINTGDETQLSIISKIGYTPSNSSNTPIISSESGTPTSIPTKIGDVYVDTTLSTHPVFYKANGTTSSDNWIKQNGSYVITASTSSTVQTPSKNTSYLFGALIGADNGLSAGALNKRMYIPKNGLLKCCQGTIVSMGNGSNEVASLYIRINDTTDILVYENILFNQARTFFINNNLSTLVSTNDFIYFKLVTPNWTTVPNYLSASGTILVET